MAAAPRSRLIEASWEVCNKVGGIHTVITSKFGEARAEFGDGYLTVGPWLWAANPAFEEAEVPAELAPSFSQLRERGVEPHYGIWKPYGQPTVLLDWSGLLPRLNDYKKRFWERFQLSTLGSDFYDFDQPFIWGISVGLLTRFVSDTSAEPVILHAHEWLTASAILTVVEEPAKAPVHTVFTTHATVLGRSISSSGADLYGKLAIYDPETEAKNRGVVAKHQLERLGATEASCFTTVSRITATEATALLGKKPDVITENGLDTETFPSYDDLSLSRSQTRLALERFLMAYFFPTGPFDLTKTSLQFTMGRPETANKGFDLHLAALGELNDQLKKEGSDHTVAAFFLIPIGCLRLRPAVSAQLTLYRRVRQQLAEIGYRQQVEQFSSLCRGTDASAALSSAENQDLGDAIRRMPLGTPPVSPYEVAEEGRDDIIRLAAQHGLHNRAEDRVKVLYFPLYLDGFDGIFDVPLYTLISGFDLGVFPSRYEPWGYTPMESLAVGVPAVTSNLAGFGRSIADTSGAPPSGVFMIDREKADADSLAVLNRIFRTAAKETEREWTDRRISAYQTVQLYSWKHLYQNYRKAYRV